MDDLIKKLAQKEPPFSIVLDDAPDVFIVPSMITQRKLEYQVSDAAPNKRGESWDCYTWEEAKKLALEMQKERF